MKDLKEQLIRLGHTNPELRDHLTPVLDKISSMRKESNLSLRNLEDGMRVRHKQHPEWGIWRVEEAAPYNGKYWSVWSEDRGHGHSKALTNPSEWELVK